VHVHRVCVGRRVVELPDLGGADGGVLRHRLHPHALGPDTGRCVGEMPSGPTVPSSARPALRRSHLLRRRPSHLLDEARGRVTVAAAAARWPAASGTARGRRSTVAAGRTRNSMICPVLAASAGRSRCRDAATERLVGSDVAEDVLACGTLVKSTITSARSPDP